MLDSTKKNRIALSKLARRLVLDFALRWCEINIGLLRTHRITGSLDRRLVQNLQWDDANSNNKIRFASSSLARRLELDFAMRWCEIKLRLLRPHWIEDLYWILQWDDAKFKGKIQSQENYVRNFLLFKHSAIAGKNENNKEIMDIKERKYFARNDAINIKAAPAKNKNCG